MSEPLTVVGSFEPIADRDDLERFLSDDGDVVDTNLFRGRRCPSEQTALSLWRIARRRGWDDVADGLATWTARRVDAAPGGLPVHDLLGKGETHTRFLADAALLLTADGRFPDEERRAHDALASLAATGVAGPWYRHDSLEADAGENHLVLNTHVHTLVARVAAGLPVDDGVAELERVLALRGEGPRALVQAAAIAAGGRLGEWGQYSAARSRTRRPYLALPGGWIARDALPSPTPSYFTVNLHDLAVLSRLVDSGAVRGALGRGVRWARATGFFRARRRARDPLAVLIPVLLRNAGHRRVAERAATSLRRAGYAPCIGWPGYEDHLWSRLPAGVP